MMDPRTQALDGDNEDTSIDNLPALVQLYKCVPLTNAIGQPPTTPEHIEQMINQAHLRLLADGAVEAELLTVLGGVVQAPVPPQTRGPLKLPGQQAVHVQLTLVATAAVFRITVPREVLRQKIQEATRHPS